MSELIREYVASPKQHVRIDRNRGIIHGVKILGLKSKNNRDYPVPVLRKAIPLYENARVNLDHPEGDPRKPRSYQDRLGIIRGVILKENEGLFADFHFNPKHPLADQLLWDAEHAPENVGFSHNVEAVLKRESDATIVEEILAVRSVDLVADPATTAGLFESTDAVSLERPLETETETDPEKSEMRTSENCPTENKEMVAIETADSCDSGNATTMESLKEEIQTLREELLQSRNEYEEKGRRLQTVLALCGAVREGFPTPEPGIGSLFQQPFLESLFSLDDEQTVQSLIEERIAFLRQLAPPKREAESLPLSRARDLFERKIDAANRCENFVRAITGKES